MQPTRRRGRGRGGGGHLTGDQRAGRRVPHSQDFPRVLRYELLTRIVGEYFIECLCCDVKYNSSGFPAFQQLGLNISVDNKFFLLWCLGRHHIC